MEDSNEVVRGLALGVIAGFLLFFSVRTEVPYPAWLVKAYEEPIVRILMFSVVFGLAMWDTSAAVLATLVVVFLHVDLTMLGAPKKENFISSTPGKPATDLFKKERASAGAGAAAGAGETAAPVEGSVILSPFYPLTEDEEPMYELNGLRPAQF